MTSYRYLNPVSRGISRKIPECYGFDVETYNNNQEMSVCSFVNDKDIAVFYTRKEALAWLDIKAEKKSRSKWPFFIVATNMPFDASVLFGRGKELVNFKPFFRDTTIITGVYKGLKFLDTMNYAPMSVEAWGDLLGCPKMRSPVNLGQKPQTEEELAYLTAYNIQDSLISFKAWQSLYSRLLGMGGRLKATIASTSLEFYRRNFQRESMMSTPKDRLAFERASYYGGRTEVFDRGLLPIGKYNMYDKVSMYPFVMSDRAYPDTRYPKFVAPREQNIEDYMGLSEVSITAPDLDYPLLPFRVGKKLIFPVGSFRGVYTHAELSESLRLGYHIEEIHRQLVFRRECSPFKDFVRCVYTRKEEATEKEIRLLMKLILNSLYGKFGARMEIEKVFEHIGTIDWRKVPEKFKIIEQYVSYERELPENKIPKYVIPVIASYVTSYARLELYKYFKEKPLYCDTDSIILDHTIEETPGLGGMKLEEPGTTGYIVKPKMYMFGDKVKIKGAIMRRPKKSDSPEEYKNKQEYNLRIFESILQGEPVPQSKFMKFRESLRRKDCSFNEVRDFLKTYTLEDNKRYWERPFSREDFQASLPLVIS